MKDERTYLITLRPIGDGPPGIIRIRHALKCLRRSFGLQAESIEEGKASSEVEVEAPTAEDVGA